MFAKGSSKPASTPDDISAFLGKETVFEGKMSFEGVFRLDGKFEGEIFESGTLIVGETAVVKGKIGIHSLIVNGLVEGDVEASTRVEVHSTGRFRGTLSTPALVVMEGGVLDGQCRMEEPKNTGSPSLHPSEKEEHPVSAEAKKKD